jgi:hypothetical protein
VSKKDAYSWTLTVGDVALPVWEITTHYWSPTDLPFGVDGGPWILSYFTLKVREVPEPVAARSNGFAAVLSNRAGVKGRGYAEVSSAQGNRNRTWSVEFSFKPDRRADFDGADTQALRVAALERELVSVRAQRDRAVEALRGLIDADTMHGLHAEYEFLDPCPTCTARAVLAKGLTESEA